MAVRLLVDLGLLAILVGIAVGFAGPIDLEFDLLSHARLHLAVGAAACLAVYLIVGTRRRAMFALVVAGAGLAGTLPWLFGETFATQAEAGPEIGTFRLMAFNVQRAFRDPDATLAVIKRADADVVVMPEMLASERLVGRLRADYPFSPNCEPREFCGAAIVSRIPLAAQGDPSGGQHRVDRATAELMVGGRIVTLVGVHAPWPFDGRAHWDGLDEIADAVRAVVGPVVVAGDFNATPWSRPLRRFVERAGVDRVGGYRATWPARFGRFGIPIDHVFYRGSVAIRDVRAVTGWAGSDHLPLVMTVAVY